MTQIVYEVTGGVRVICTRDDFSTFIIIQINRQEYIILLISTAKRLELQYTFRPYLASKIGKNKQFRKGKNILEVFNVELYSY